MHIRDASDADAEVVVELVQELAESAGESSAITTENVISYLSTPGSAILLAEEDGQVIGLLSYATRPNLYHAAPSCLIEELVVCRAARGRGVGGALLHAVLDRARAADCAEVSISAMPDNARAIALYKRLGFTDEAVLLEQHMGA